MAKRIEGITAPIFDLSNRVAIVTGASSGIGAAIAATLAAFGARVVAVGRNAGRLANVVGDIRLTGGTAEAVVSELTDVNGIEQVIGAALRAFGQLDVIVHAAGIFIPATVIDTTADDFFKQWAVNVRVPFDLTKAALPYLKAGSSIIFVSSTAARVGFANTTAYAASKAAVDAMTRVMAIELAPRGICVNGIAPGWTATPMNARLREDPAVVAAAIAATPAGRLAVPEDIAPSVVFLASEASRFIQGVVLDVGGGYPSLPDVIRRSATAHVTEGSS
jgi:NAD(P)-dependent dehydrogenase (short-subunit alcohol dehydrogenase family)